MIKHKFFTKSVSFNVEKKSKQGKDYYVSGFIITDDKDLVNDVVTRACMRDLVRQLNAGNIKLDIEHEAFDNDNGTTSTIPIGRIIEAKFVGDKVWVKAILNKDSPVFKIAWNSVKNKFLDAFSITFQPLKFINQVINGIEIRLLNTIRILNVALTGNPANPEASIERVFMKSIKEEMKMTDEEVKKEEVQEEKVEEEKVEEKKEEESTEEEKPEPEAEQKGMDYKKMYEDMKAKYEKDKVEKKSVDELTALKAEVKSLKDKLEAPILKAKVEKKSEEVPKGEELSDKPVNILGMCQ